MKYIALLRGINVGGNSIIKMNELKEAVEKCGFTNVQTYIQSGNVLLESDEKESEKITAVLEESLSKNFKIDLRLVVISEEQLKTILKNIPNEWNSNKDIRKYIAFLRKPITSQDIVKVVQIKEGIDFIKAGTGVVYMSTSLEGITKSGFPKLATKNVYHYMTIRNYNTALKLLTKLERIA